MIELHVKIQGDKEEEGRLRAVLAREGFRVADIRDGNSDAEPRTDAGGEENGIGADAPGSVDELSRRIEELELRVRELKNLDVAKSQFLANVSHELRTPLTAIVTYGEVLCDGLLGELNARQGEAVQSVIGSSRQLLTMIEEILTYARTGAQAIELEPTEFDIAAVIRDVHQMSGSLMRKKRLRFESRVGRDIPRAQADRDKILHVLGNLVGNAIEFTPPEGLISVSVGRSDRSPQWLEVVVADSGIGIDAKHHEMIFREFAQVDSSRARRHHGTGLGLAIARNFIQLHGGEIWVESALGEGSRFYFTLPSVDATEALGAA